MTSTPEPEAPPPAPPGEPEPAPAASPAPVQYNVVDQQWAPSDPAPAQAMLTAAGQAGWQLAAVYPDPQRERTRWVYAAAAGAVQYKVVDQQWSPSDPGLTQAMLTQVGQAGWQLAAVYPDQQREKTRWIFSIPPAATTGGGISEAPADGALYLRQGSTASWQLPPPPAQNRNRLINGHFVVDQYNNFAQVAAPSAGLVCDRWKTYQTQTSKLNTQTFNTSGLLGISGFITITTATAFTAAAADVFQIYQPVEFQNIGDFAFGTAAASPVTLSFWAKASIAGTYSGSVQNGASSHSYVFTFALAASTWTKVITTIPGDTAGTWSTDATSAGLYLIFDLGTGSSARTATVGSWITVSPAPVGATGSVALVANAGASLSFANVQLELGNVATPFDWRSVGDTLRQCQRYFQDIWFSLYAYTGTNVSLGGAVVTTSYPVVMRAPPTVFVTDNIGSGSWTGSTTPAYTLGTDYVRINAAASQVTAGAYLIGRARLIAEL